MRTSGALQAAVEIRCAGEKYDALATLGNDLQAPAIALQPGIAEVLAALSALPGSLLARMSGSGATCFALFDAEAERDTAAITLAQRHPGWWQMAGALR